jgi:enterochelin esterase-like enzyme
MPRPRRWLGLLALAVVGRGLDGVPALADPTGACADPSHRLESFALPAPELGRAKRILVYLPPGYDCAPQRRYPAFYLNDGHDLFDWNPFAAGLDPAVAAEIALREAWYGSWRLEAQLDRAIAAGQLPRLIVVGIASDDGMRSRDLAPVPWDGSAEARGAAAYGDFVADHVVETIDTRYRTVAERRCRGIGGASLGAVSALQLGLAHARRFSLVLALSPVLGERSLAASVAAAWARADPVGPSTFLIDFDDDPIGAADRVVPCPARRCAGPRAPDHSAADPGRSPFDRILGRTRAAGTSPADRCALPRLSRVGPRPSELAAVAHRYRAGRRCTTLRDVAASCSPPERAARRRSACASRGASARSR